MNTLVNKTAATTQVKTIDINAKEWFDKVNGNSYWSAQVTINFGMPDSKTVYVPFQYGYGNHYESVSLKQLQTDGILPNDETIYAPWRYCQDKGIVYRAQKQASSFIK
jgi:hypothetical protein